jgi:hypothetical protein
MGQAECAELLQNAESSYKTREELEKILWPVCRETDHHAEQNTVPNMSADRLSRWAEYCAQYVSRQVITLSRIPCGMSGDRIPGQKAVNGVQRLLLKSIDIEDVIGRGYTPTEPELTPL